MMNVTLYVEGGGDGAALQSRCREGFRRWLEAAGFGRGRLPHIVAAGSRDEAFRQFRIAMLDRGAEELSLLLVDSEDAVAPGATVWDHLKAPGVWVRPAHATDKQAFLMVRCMETWLLADPVALASYFGHGWNGKALPARSALETVDKEAVLKALDRATARCGRSRYAKGKVSFELLGRISPALVERACPHAKEFLDALRELWPPPK